MNTEHPSHPACQKCQHDIFMTNLKASPLWRTLTTLSRAEFDAKYLRPVAEEKSK